MKKSFVLFFFFSVFFLSNSYAEYVISESDNEAEPNFNNYVYDESYQLDSNNLWKYWIGENECSNLKKYYKIWDDLVILCLDEKENIEVFLNGQKFKDKITKSVYTDSWIYGVKIDWDNIYVDIYNSDFISWNLYKERYIYKNILSKEDLKNNNKEIRDSLRWTSFYKYLSKFDDLLWKMNDKQLKKLKIRVEELIKKYEWVSNNNLLSILYFINNKIKIEIWEYSYESNFNVNDFVVNIKNDEENKKVIYWSIENKDITGLLVSNSPMSYKNMDVASYSYKRVDIVDWNWEYQTNNYYSNKIYYIHYYTKDWFYYKEMINDSDNINKDNFKLYIKNDSEWNKVLYWEVLDSNVKSIKIENWSINVENFNWWKWEQNSNSKAWKMDYRVAYYDENGNFYFFQKIYID